MVALRMPEALDLVVVSSEPLCAETPLALQQGVLTPVSRFFVRDHFPVPEPPTNLAIGGEVAHPITLTASDLRQFPRRQLTATLECAGNGRSYLNPPVSGEPWGLGAVGTAEWSGTSLLSVLEPARLADDVVEILFTSADGFARSLPLDRALHADTLVVNTMNGEPLSRAHGAPLRLLVPGWYGMASVKWLARIEAIRAPYLGHFQVERYVIDDRPIRAMQPRSVIVEPHEGAIVQAGQRWIRGYAWTGDGRVVSVDLSDDSGQTWAAATLLGKPQAYTWHRWEFDWQPKAPGPVTVVARALDSTGLTQPLQQAWNTLGYCNNAAVPRHLYVSAD
jgi:DMSO/TMAO reductase YedYZ molybdopterin-dependent catalytic subunit